MDKAKKELVIITGMSGAGKSEAMNFLRTGNTFALTIFLLIYFSI